MLSRHGLVEAFIVENLSARHVINHLVADREVVVDLVLVLRPHTMEQISKEAHEAFQAIEKVRRLLFLDLAHKFIYAVHELSFVVVKDRFTL